MPCTSLKRQLEKEPSSWARKSPLKVTSIGLDHINTFVAVAKHGSFSVAGRKVFLSQSAITSQIRQLEEEYGEKLFSRRGKGMRLTSAGRVLFEYAERLTELRAESLRAVADHSSAPGGLVRIGANEATVLYVLPGFLSRFSEMYSNVQISIYRNFSHKVLERVEDGTIDLGIVTLPVKSRALTIYPIYRDRVMLMVGAKNPLATLGTVTAKDIATQPLIFPKTGSTRRLLEKFFRIHATKPHIAMELPSITMIKRYVSANLGVSLISEGFAADEARAGRVKLLTIKGVELWRELGLIYRRDRHLSSQATAFVDTIRSESTVTMAE
jgi:DNA-binding transcriptional LysR family regulator